MFLLKIKKCIWNCETISRNISFFFSWWTSKVLFLLVKKIDIYLEFDLLAKTIVHGFKPNLMLIFCFLRVVRTIIRPHCPQRYNSCMSRDRCYRRFHLGVPLQVNTYFYFQIQKSTRVVLRFHVLWESRIGKKPKVHYFAVYFVTVWEME